MDWAQAEWGDGATQDPSHNEVSTQPTKSIFRRRALPIPKLSFSHLSKVQSDYSSSAKLQPNISHLIQEWDDFWQEYIHACYTRMKCANCNNLHGKNSDRSARIWEKFVQEFAEINKPGPNHVYWEKGKEWGAVDAIVGTEEELREFGETGMGEGILREWERSARWIETLYFLEVRGSACECEGDGFWEMTSREIEMHPDDRPLRIPGMRGAGRRSGSGRQSGNSGGFTRLSHGENGAVEESFQIFQGAVGGVMGRGGESIKQIRQQSGCKNIKIPGKNEPKLKPRELVTITLTGTAEQNAVARQMIEMIYEEWGNRPRGQRRERNDYDSFDAGGNNSIGEGSGDPRTTFESGFGDGGWGENGFGTTGEWGAEDTGGGGSW